MPFFLDYPINYTVRLPWASAYICLSYTCMEWTDTYTWYIPGQRDTGFHLLTIAHELVASRDVWLSGKGHVYVFMDMCEGTCACSHASLGFLWKG